MTDEYLTNPCFSWLDQGDPYFPHLLVSKVYYVCTSHMRCAVATATTAKSWSPGPKKSADTFETEECEPPVYSWARVRDTQGTAKMGEIQWASH